MFGRDNCLIYLVFTLCCLGASLPLAAQNPDEQVRRLLQAGDSLRLSYRFQGSKDAYEDALEMVADTALAMQDTLLIGIFQEVIITVAIQRKAVNTELRQTVQTADPAVRTVLGTVRPGLVSVHKDLFIFVDTEFDDSVLCFDVSRSQFRF